jgi:hypothetical protein
MDLVIIAGYNDSDEIKGKAKATGVSPVAFALTRVSKGIFPFGGDC